MEETWVWGVGEVEKGTGRSGWKENCSWGALHEWNIEKMLNPLVYEMNLRLFLNFYLIALQVQNKYRITKIPTELSGKEN